MEFLLVHRRIVVFCKSDKWLFSQFILGDETRRVVRSSFVSSSRNRTPEEVRPLSRVPSADDNSIVPVEVWPRNCDTTTTGSTGRLLPSSLAMSSPVERTNGTRSDRFRSDCSRHVSTERSCPFEVLIMVITGRRATPEPRVLRVPSVDTIRRCSEFKLFRSYCGGTASVGCEECYYKWTVLKFMWTSRNVIGVMFCFTE